LALFAAGSAVVLLAAAVLYQRQPVRVVEVLAQCEPEPMMSSAPVPVLSLPVVEPAWPGAQVKVALEHLTQVVQ